MRICGIDPGLRHTGWGIIEIDGNHLSWVADGAIDVDASLTDAMRLGCIRDGLAEIIEQYKPDAAAIEEVFVSVNASSALKLGMARGAALIALNDFGLSIEAISPRRVKQNITGSGRADKTQVAQMVKRLLGVMPKTADSADALAIAIAACNQGRLDEKIDSASTKTSQTQTPQTQTSQTQASQTKGRKTGLEAAIMRAITKEQA